MDDEAFHRSIRKFLRTVGVTSQREIEQWVRDQLDSGSLRGDETLEVHATVTIPGLSRTVTIPGELKLSNGPPSGD